MTTAPAGSAANGDAAVAARLKTIWMELLNVPQIADSDNFVELGGDSVAATLCINRIRDQLNVELSVTALLLDEATLASLCREVEELRPQPAS